MMNGMTLRQFYHANMDHDLRHRWYAWRPVKVHNYCGGVPTGHEPKVVWCQWLEREYDINFNFWRYYEIEDEQKETNSTEV